MPKIILTMPDGTEQRYRLEGEKFSLGRAADNDVVLADQRASSHHAVLKKGSSGDFIISDLGATNPIRVNGRPIENQELKHGDTFMIGDVFARYESEVAATASTTSSASTPPAGIARASGAAPAPAAATSGAPAAPRRPGPQPTPDPASGTPAQGGGCFAVLVALLLCLTAAAALAAAR